MELVFNDLSFRPFCDNEQILKERFLRMLKLYQIVKDDFGYNHLIFPSDFSRYRVTSDKTFIEWVSAIGDTKDKNDILRVPFVRPFLDEMENLKKSELPRYYYTNNEAMIIEESCLGLATAFLMEKLTISIDTHDCWGGTQISFREIYNDDLDTNDVIVQNISRDFHLLDKSIKEQLMYKGKLQLKLSNLSPDQKTIKLSGDHHGNDKLEFFAKKLFKSPYVESVVNNIDFSPKAIRLIKNTYSDGKIDIVLHWEDEGFGMVIQTTGRNKRETEEISKILIKEFDR